VALLSFIGAYLAFTYEYTFSPKNFTLWNSIFSVSLEKKQRIIQKAFLITPFASCISSRNKRIWSKGLFFVEGFGKFVTGRWNLTHFTSEENKYACSCQTAVSRKWINSSDFRLKFWLE
jgi:hypothetical protein